MGDVQSVARKTCQPHRDVLHEYIRLQGSYGSRHLGTTTTILGVDPVPRKGVSRILLTFDHRVIDGTPVTRTLQQLQHTLTTAIKVELAELIGVHPETGETLSEEEQNFVKKQQRARRIAANRKRNAA